jgi:spore germination protein GerM
MRKSRFTGFVALAAAFALTACGAPDNGADPGSDGTPTGTDTPMPTDAPTTPTETEPSETEPTETPAADVGAAAYFMLMSGEEGPFLTPVWLPGVGDVEAALTALLAGPEAALAGTEFGTAGLSTAIPEGTELLGVTVTDGTATVNLSETFDDGGGSASIMGRLAQLVYTATQFDAIDDVVLELAGDEVEVFSAEGLELDQPMDRTGAYDTGFIPKLYLDRPAYGQTVGTDFELAGVARDLFEATFVYELSDSADTIFAQGPVTASGSEGWNDYSIDVGYSAADAMPITVTLYEGSAKDGSIVFMISRPIRIDPAS